MFAGAVAPLLLAAWAVAMILALWNAARLDQMLSDIERRQMARTEFISHALGVAVCAILWAVAMLVFGPQGTEIEHYALWALVAMLVAGSAANMASVPLAPMVFAVLSGAAGALSLC